MTSPDSRINPYRSDIAAEHLRGIVDAPSYVVGVPLTLYHGIAVLHKEPDTLAEQVSVMRYGDVFTVYESTEQWLWGQCARDGYVGYTVNQGFFDQPLNPTHRIKKSHSFLFPEPSIKKVPMDTLTFLSGVEVEETDGKFSKLKGGGFIHAHHLTPMAEWAERDIVFTAGRFLGIPYLWGGNTSLGLDCSGLVQIACEAAGIACPRDSDMQAASLGQPVNDHDKLHRGDFVFFQGHVGIMTDPANLLHANAYHGCVVVEPLADVVARGSAVTIVRRLT
ncbi:MAG: NlpC/P60 family protein [Alphaproteobacteria bacterium]|nr:NlpC/P60 family protein [Alphaproteobacteria bacterium]